MWDLIFKTFIKNYQDTSSPKVREDYGKLASLVGILTNLLLCLTKIAVGLLARSIAIVADGVNNLADASSSLMTLVGFKLASAPEDEEHPFGHARIEYLTGLLVSLVIILLGGQLFVTSFKKILNPDPVEFSYITVGILILAILTKVWQALFYIASGNRINSLTLKATGIDSRNDVIATSGVLLSLIIGRVTGLQVDGVMGCIVALFIVWSGIQLVKETADPLLGQSPDPELVKEILDEINDNPEVVGCHDLMIHNYGPGRIFASVHIEVDADKDIMVSHDMIDNIERHLSTEHKINLVVHMDPVKLNDPLLSQIKELLKETILPLKGVCGIHDVRTVPGPTHTNVIFDAVVTPGCIYDAEDISRMAKEAFGVLEVNFNVVVSLDLDFTNFH